MKRMTIPVFLATGMLAFTLAGCSGSNSQPMSEETLMGLWQLDSQSEVGFDAYVQFEDEDYVELLIADSWLEGSWSVSGTEGTIEVDDERQVKLSYDGNKLTMGQSDGSRLIFSKDDSGDKTLDDLLNESYDLDSADMTYDNDINSIDAVTIADDDRFAITVTGKGTDYTGDPGYQLMVTNKTDKAVFVIPDDTFTVNGVEIDSGLEETIDPGETVETFMYFSQDDLAAGVDGLVAVDGVIYVGDDETGDEVATYPFHMD